MLNQTQYQPLTIAQLKQVTGGHQLPKNLVMLRTNAQLSRRALAEKLNVCTSTIARYEEGKRVPDVDLIIQMADLFNTTCDRMLK
ncbi:helix-turn-helix domain-containing protein [Leuconostoc lactis]